MNNTITTRIRLRYDTVQHWEERNPVLLKGELAIVEFPSSERIDSLSDTTPSHTPPAIGIKVGDGETEYNNLPWLQAVAADVYNWAKESRLLASNVEGLSDYILNTIGGNMPVSVTPRFYQLVPEEIDTQQYPNKRPDYYYLRSTTDINSNNWEIDTAHPIDLSKYNQIYNWIGNYQLNNYGTLYGYLRTQFNTFLESISYNKTRPEHQFITNVTQSNGIINVVHAQPAFSDISGTATVEQGGTGKNTLPENEVLVGNGTEAIKTIPIDNTVTNNNHLATNRAIKTYVDDATAGLTGAMHFIGVSLIEITNGGGQIPKFSNEEEEQIILSSGDVVIYGDQEFVWNGERWKLLGDEGSYIVHGGILDTDIAEGVISQSKIHGLNIALNEKVDKEEGKTLTSHDFSDEFYNKLRNLPANAQENIIEHIFLNGTEITPTTIEQLQKVINIEINEFDQASQTKLQGIQNNAEVNTIQGIKYGTTTLEPDENRIITIDPDPQKIYENKIEHIIINGHEYAPKDKIVEIKIDQSALDLNVLEGAEVPKESGLGKDEVEQIEKKLQLQRIAITGDVKDLKQRTNDTYIILDCGTSNSDSHVPKQS